MFYNVDHHHTVVTVLAKSKQVLLLHLTYILRFSNKSKFDEKLHGSG